jgi:opacity protein-like surface antigen
LTKRTAALAAACVALACVVASPNAHAEEPARPPGPRDVGVGVGVYAGLGLGFGQVAKGLPLEGRLGVAPTLAGEIAVRVAERVSLGGLAGGGFGTATPAPCRDAIDGYHCASASFGALGLFGRYHLEPHGNLEPWVGLGFGTTFLVESSERSTVEAASAPCGGAGGDCSRGYSTDRRTVRVGAEVLVGAGISFRLSSALSLGFAVQAFVGPYLTNTVSDSRSAGGSDSRGLGRSDGIHALVVPTLHLECRYPN